MIGARAAALALAALLAAGAATAQQQKGPPDVPAGKGRIEGRVLHAATGKPVPHVPVLLYALKETSVPGLRRGESGDDGSFSFDGVSQSPDVAYLVGARTGDVPFPGDRVSFAPGESVAHVDIRVTDVTTDSKDVGPAETTFRVARDASGLRVTARVALHNGGSDTYYVPAASRSSTAPAFALRLPDGATDFKMPLGVVPEGVVHEGASLRYFGPVYPGDHDLGFSFAVPPEHTGAGGKGGGKKAQRFAFTPRSAATLLVPMGLGTVEGAPRKGDKPEVVDGRHYDAYTLTPGRRVALALPPARIDPGAIHVTETQIVVQADDAALEVNESHQIEVKGGGQVLGTADRPLLRVPLPAEATDVRFGTDAAGVELVPSPKGGLAAVGTLGGSEAHVELSYRLAVSKPPARLVRSFASPVELLSVFVADTGNLRLTSKRLHRRRPVRTNDLTYAHLEAFAVKAGEPVDLTIETLPPRAEAPRAVLTAAIGAGALLTIGLLVAPLWRSASGDEPQPVEAEAGPSLEREALYAAIHDLDHDFETGKLAEEDHAAMRQELRERAVALLRAERAAAAPPPVAAAPAAPPKDAPAPATLAPAPAAPPSAAAPGPGARFCTHCGLPAAPEHNFCGRCGTALPSVTALAAAEAPRGPAA